MSDLPLVLILAVGLIAYFGYMSYNKNQEVKQVLQPQDVGRNPNVMSGEQQMWLGLGQTFSNPFGLNF